MSTSPSWFDQDKFARLKKVGPKVVLKPLSTTAPLPEVAGNPPPTEKESQFLPEQKAPEPLPEKKDIQPVPEEKATETLPEKEAEQPLPEALEIEPEPQVEEVPPAPEEAASEPTETPESASLPETEKDAEEELVPVTPPPLSASQRLMTSQSVSLKNISKEIPPVAPPTPAPIRAPLEVIPDGLKPSLNFDSKVLLRRTSSLPALKAIGTTSVVLDPAASLPVRAPATSAAMVQSAEDLAAAWEKITQLNNDLLASQKERDQAVNENVLLRDQLKQADEQITLQDAAIEHTEAMDRIKIERDDALADAKSLREELQQTLAAKASAVPSEELDQATDERDLIRRQYTELREHFENLKQEVLHGRGDAEGGEGSSEELAGVRFQLTAKEQELGTVRSQLSELENERDSIRLQLSAQRAEMEISERQLTERAKEIESLGQQLSAKEQELSTSSQSGGGNEAEVTSLREQLEQAKEEATIPQRGLALSQKALKETRDALREASDGATLAKASLENIKKENSTLVQQNMLLQAQHDQVSRELSSVKAKLMAKG